MNRIGGKDEKFNFNEQYFLSISKYICWSFFFVVFFMFPIQLPFVQSKLVNEHHIDVKPKIKERKKNANLNNRKKRSVGIQKRNYKSKWK